MTGLVIDHWTEDRRKTDMSRTYFYDLGTKGNGGQLSIVPRELSHPVVT